MTHEPVAMPSIALARRSNDRCPLAQGAYTPCMSRVTPLLCPLLVGRDDLLNLADRRLADAAAGHGQFILLAGEAGVFAPQVLVRDVHLAADLEVDQLEHRQVLLHELAIAGHRVPLRAQRVLELLVVEGTYVLQLDELDARIFLEATHEDTEERRRVRNRDIDAPIVAQVLAIEHGIIAAQRELADIVVGTDFRIVR